MLPVLLGFVAGAADTASFLAVGGLFSAHVTGNLVLLSASLVRGTPDGVAAKLLSLPVFILFAALTRIVGDWLNLSPRGWFMLMLPAEAVLLAAFMAIGLVYGPVGDADAPHALLSGFCAVGAMGIQNALGRITLRDAPTTTVMTSNLSQLCVDLAGLVGEWDLHKAGRAGQIAVVMAAFMAGCAAAALTYARFGFWCAVLPLAGSLLTLLPAWRWSLTER